MGAHDSLLPLQPALAATQAFVDATGCPGVVIGGVAVGLVAWPRATKDIDATIIADTDNLEELLAMAARFDLVPRPEHEARFAKLQRILLLVHAPTQVSVDVSLGALPFEVEMAERAATVVLAGVKVRVPMAEDLVIMKALAHRSQDMADIAAITAAHPDLDRKRIERWVQDFADTLEMPELWDDIVPLLKAP